MRGENKKNNLLILKDLFWVANQYVPTIDDKKLVDELKLKFANLPCPTPRSDFPHIQLTQKNQLDILIDGLQQQENEAIMTFCQEIEKKVPT